MMKRTIIGSLSVLIVIMLACFQNVKAETLVWEPGSGEITGYRVYYGITPNSYTETVNVGNVTESKLDPLPLEVGKTYYFAIKAYNSAVESDFSNSVSWTVNDNTPPLPPKGLKAE